MRAPGGAGLLPGVLAVEQQHPGRGLGHPVALQEGQPPLGVALEQRGRDRRAAAEQVADARQVGPVEAR